jgi:hypothetical protein
VNHASGLALSQIRQSTTFDNNSNLLGIGFISLACTVVAVILVSTGLPQSTVWTWSSLVWLIFLLPFLAWFLTRTNQLRREPYPPGRSHRQWTYYFSIFLIVEVAAAAVQLANAVFLAEFWLFLVGLAVLLLLGVVQFIRLLWFGLFYSEGAIQAAEVGNP